MIQRKSILSDKRNFLYLLIVFVGLLQILGYVLQNKIIRGIGSALTASPLPIVFTEVKGIETFASDFEVAVKRRDGSEDHIKITPALYSELSGPYNRRNVYGACFAYGPVLPDSITRPILNYGFCSEKVLLKEMRIDADTGSQVSINIRTRTAGRNDHWEIKVICP
jgi:hypothetical protein